MKDSKYKEYVTVEVNIKGNIKCMSLPRLSSASDIMNDKFPKQ